MKPPETGMVAVRRALLARESADERSLAWLGRQMDPPLSRAAISAWEQVPDNRLAQVAKILGIDVRILRPDLAKIFQ